MFKSTPDFYKYYETKMSDHVLFCFQTKGHLCKCSAESRSLAEGMIITIQSIHRFLYGTSLFQYVIIF